MGTHKFCRIANRSVTSTCKNCLCLRLHQLLLGSISVVKLDWPGVSHLKSFVNFFSFFMNKVSFFGKKLLLLFVLGRIFFLTSIVFVQVRFDFSFCCKLGWQYYIQFICITIYIKRSSLSALNCFSHSNSYFPSDRINPPPSPLQVFKFVKSIGRYAY